MLFNLFHFRLWFHRDSRSQFTTYIGACVFFFSLSPVGSFVRAIFFAMFASNRLFCPLKKRPRHCVTFHTPWRRSEKKKKVSKNSCTKWEEKEMENKMKQIGLRSLLEHLRRRYRMEKKWWRRRTEKETGVRIGASRMPSTTTTVARAISKTLFIVRSSLDNHL